MKTRDLMATMWVGLVIVAVTLGLVTAGVLLDNRELRREGRDLRSELDARSTEAADLETERSLIEQELRAQRERVEAMTVQLAELKLRGDAKEPVVPQQAFRVRAFLDNQWVSQGWLVPGRSTTNASGQLVYEPVVVLDPSARTALTAARPPAAPESPSSITVNHNYPTTTETVWPAIWIAGGGHHQRPDPPVELPPRFPPQPKPQPQPVSPFLSTRIWQPQTGWQQMPRGRAGGEWISTSPRGHSYLSGGAGGGVAGGGGTGTFPARY